MSWLADFRKIQRGLGLMDDGRLGPRTVAALERELDRLRAYDEAAAGEGEHPPTKYSYGGPDVRRQGYVISRDPQKLLPGFAAKVELLFQRMREAGFKPMLWEGVRSFERAEMLSKRGTGIRNSIHCYGGAVDIVDSDDSPWTAPPGFWGTLRREAEELGLHVLRDRNGRPKDLPHVQAIPVSEQNAFRAMTDAERAERVA